MDVYSFCLLVPRRSFATPVRGTCYGISAALGKTGAAVGTQAFTPIQNNLGKKYVQWHYTREPTNEETRWTFIIAAICGVTGILVTYFFVPDMTGEPFGFLSAAPMLIRKQASILRTRIASLWNTSLRMAGRVKWAMTTTL